MTKFSIGLALAIALGSGGCGVFEEEEDKGQKVDEVESELTGKWQSACEAKGPFGIIDLSSERQEMDFSAIGDVVKTTHLYSDKECQDALYKQDITATYAVVGDTAEVQDAKNLNITVHKAEITPANEDAAAKMNDNKLCDKTDWQATVTQEVTGIECDGKTFTKGQVIFDIYDVQEKNLFVGEASFFLDGSGADERPTKLDREHPLVKQ